MFRIVFVLAAGALVLAGCQVSGRSVSLDEAKQITAKFEGKSFTPPPRKVTDIIALLSNQSEESKRKIEALKAEANKTMPSGLSPRDKATFLVERGSARESIGWNIKALSDLTSALLIAKKEGIDDWASGSLLRIENLNYKIASIHGSVGKLTDDLKFREEAIRTSIHGGGISKRATTGLRYSQLGNIAKAKKYYESVRTKIIESHTWKNQFYGPIERSIGRAVLARSSFIEGKHKLAEQGLRREISAVIDDKNSGKDGSRYSGNYTMDGIWTRLLWLYHNWLSEALLAQARYSEAEVEVRAAIKIALEAFGPQSPRVSESIILFSSVLVNMGRFDEAVEVADTAQRMIKIGGASKGSFMQAKARSALASSLMGTGNWRKSLEAYERLRSDMLEGDPETYHRAFETDPNYLLTRLQIGKVDGLDAIIDVAYKRASDVYGEKHYNTAEILGFRAMSAVLSGDDLKAAEHFKKSAAIIANQGAEGGAATLITDLRRRVILEDYLKLLRRIKGTATAEKLNIDVIPESFQIVSAIRKSKVASALSSSGARAASNNPDLADLIRREQDASREVAAVNALQAAILQDGKAVRNKSILAQLSKRSKDLRLARNSLQGEIEGRFPEYAELVSPKGATLQSVRKDLQKGETLIVTYVGKDETYLWGVPASGQVMFETTPHGSTSLKSTIDEIRTALEPNAETLGDIPAFNVAKAHSLYKALLEPIKQAWQDSSDLLIVADGPLGYLPFALLPKVDDALKPQTVPLFSRYAEVHWLIRDHGVTVLPSVASLKTLRSIPASRTDRKPFAGFGDPYFNIQQASDAKSKPTQANGKVLASRGIKLASRGIPVRLRAAPTTSGMDSARLGVLPRLEDTADEVRSIATAMNADLTKDVFTGARASEELVKTLDLSGYRVLAFATHGLVPGDLDGLTQPALALSSPDVTGDKNDGLLTMAEIMTLKLDADWIVLSACNTGSGDGAGAEAVSGLGQAFFYAGSRALLVSNWPVETTSAKLLTTDLFRRQAKDKTLNRSQALRQSMLGLIDGPGVIKTVTGEAIFTYAHPIFWAPFSLIGDGGGRANPVR